MWQSVPLKSTSSHIDAVTAFHIRTGGNPEWRQGLPVICEESENCLSRVCQRRTWWGQVVQPRRMECEHPFNILSARPTR